MRSIVKCRSKTKSKSRKLKGGSSSSDSSGSSLLKELESKYSNTSLPNSASVEKMLDELNPTSKSEKNKGLGIVGVVGIMIAALAAVMVGKKL
jgi:hypothetical protein